MTYRIAQRPDAYHVLRYRRPVVKLNASGRILALPAPDGILEGSRADVSFGAGLVMEKFAWHIPDRWEGFWRAAKVTSKSGNGETGSKHCASMGAYQLESWCAMPSSFRLIGLPFQPFAALFALTDAQLLERHARRVFAETKPGYPCRVSLADADIGDELLLLPFKHQPANSPYKWCGPIFVRKAAMPARVEAGVVPDYVRTRLISVRAYDVGHLMTDATVCPGSEVATAIQKMFRDNEIAYIHLHNANRGCFSCAVVRA